jgi:hypothetical protein
LRKLLISGLRKPTDWRGFVYVFLEALIGGISISYAFILLVDPYGVAPFSLSIDRHIMSHNARFMFPQLVRSGRFDALVIGTSTSGLLDPEELDGLFQFASQTSP